MKQKVVYVISDIDKALAFEWIADKLDKDKFDISFILLNGKSGSALETFLSKIGVQSTYIQCGSKKDWPAVFLSLCRCFRKSKPDIVHCHLLTASILGLLAARFSGVKSRIYTRHHSDYHFRYFPKGVKWDKFINSLATCIIAPSNSVKSVLTNREGVNPEKIKLIHHGFDLAYFQNVDDELKAIVTAQYNPSRKYPVIGVISRFTELKGIQYIIPAFQKLLNDYPDALLLLFNARGDYELEINEMLGSLPKQSYTKVPFENELAAVYCLFDIFTQVSTDKDIEAFGQTYVEALTAGVPSVFTLSGVANDFIQNEHNALVVPYRDSESIYKAYGKILSNKNFANNLVSLGRASVKEEFNLEKMIQNLENTYTKAILQ